MKEIVRTILRIYFKVFYRVEVKGVENVPLDKGVLICSNHLTGMDMFFIGYRLKPLVHYMAKEVLFKIPLVSPFIRKLGAFPVKRGVADVGSVKTALKLLNNNKIVGIFPEGTRTKGKDKSKIKVKLGAVTIAVKANVPIVPVAIEGGDKLFSKVRVIFGKPFNLDLDPEKKYSKEELVEVAENIMQKIYGLLEEN